MRTAEGEERSTPAAAPNAREALAPAIAAVRQRAGGSRRHGAPGVAVASAQAAALSPEVEQRRSAAGATVAALDAAETAEIQRSAFKARLRQAIDAATPRPQSADEAERVMNTGGSRASSALRGELTAESRAAQGSLGTAAEHEVEPSSLPAPQAGTLLPEAAGPPPAPVSAAPVVPAPLPPERLDYSADRGPTERLMAENHVTEQQMREGNDPAFGPALEARSSAEQHEATAAAQYRQAEAGVQAQAHAEAALALAQDLTAMHGVREGALGRVGAQQQGVRDRDAQERRRITDAVAAIKDRTRAEVETILSTMQTDAEQAFEAGLARAEKAYEDAFEEAKGGLGNWLANWGDDWKALIQRSLATARAEYMRHVDQAIDEVSTLVEGRLQAARQRVDEGLAEVERYVAGLDAGVRQFGEEALQAVSADFEAMGGEIDQRRDGLIDRLTEQYKASHERMSAAEQRLRDENKGLWARVHDATLGPLQQIAEFRDMLLGLLGRAAGVVNEILTHPIRFLGNLAAGVAQGLRNFMSKIGTHLQKGLMDWLFGALGGAGLVMPEAFDLKGVVGLVLQILGITYANFRSRAVAIVGEPVVSAIERTAEVFVVLVTEGVAGLWRFIKDQLANFKSMVIDAIFDFIKERVIMAGITWIIGLLNPASAFFKACKAIYDIVMFFVSRGRQLLSLVEAVIDSMASIARGAVGTAANLVENALTRGVPFLIGGLASLLGLGDPATPVRAFINRAQAPVNRAMDWVIRLAVRGVRAVGRLLGIGGNDGARARSQQDLGLAVQLDMHGEGHTIFTEIHDGRLVVEMASNRRENLLGLTAMAIRETENPIAKRRLERVWSKLKDAEEKVSFLISDSRRDAEAIAEARKMTQEAADALKAIGAEYGISSLRVIPHKSKYVASEVSGYSIREEYRSSIRQLFYQPMSYTPATRRWKREFVAANPDPNNPNNFIDHKGRSEPKSTATIDHQPRVVEHWLSEGRRATQSSRSSWYSDHSSGHLRIVAAKYNSSDGAEARNQGLRYEARNVGENFTGPGED